MHKIILSLIFIVSSYQFYAQQTGNAIGIIAGNVMDSSKKALQGATVSLISLKDTSVVRYTLSDKNGNFLIKDISFDFYKLRITFIGYKTLTLDSIYFRKERFDFNLSDIMLKDQISAKELEEVIIYVEKPLIESKDGNITFNAGESPLSASSNASELLE